MNYWKLTINNQTKEFEKTWLDLGEVVNFAAPFFSDIFLLFCVGDNSLGKTYSVENFFVQKMLEGEKCCWIRNTSAECKTTIDGWLEVFRDPGRAAKYFARDNEYYKTLDFSKVFKVSSAGIYRLRKDSKGQFMIPVKQFKSIDEDYYELLCPFVWAKNGDLSIPQFEPVKYFCWDEIIPSNKAVVGTQGIDFTMKNPKLFLQKCINRLNRNFDTPICFFLANPNVLESDIYTSFGVKHDWDELVKGNDCIQVDYERHIVNLVFPRCDTWTNERLSQQTTRNKILNYGDETGVYNFLPSSMKTIYGKAEIDYTNLPVKCGFVVNCECYLLCENNSDDNTWLYMIRRLEWIKYWDIVKTGIPFYCFTFADKDASLNKGIYITHNDDFARKCLAPFTNCMINNYPEYKYFIYDSLYSKVQTRDFMVNVERIVLKVEVRDEKL